MAILEAVFVLVLLLLAVTSLIVTVYPDDVARWIDKLFGLGRDR